MANGTKVLELRIALEPDNGARAIAWYWDQWNNQRDSKREQWSELKKYIFATDTKTTANNILPWSNTTTTPKLCQIRDNLHSNYISALFPNDKWLQWTAYTKDSASHEKAKTITAYMDNKAREGGLRSRISRLVLDYIDYGNAFAQASYEARYNRDTVDDSIIPSYIGPLAERISPEDIVFNPLASSFKNTPKIVRSVKTIGELLALAETSPDSAFWRDVVARRLDVRSKFGAYKAEDWSKASQYSVDGFGNLYEYYMSNYVEILEFYGDLHVEGSMEVKTNRMMTIVDRCHVVRDVPINTYSGNAPIYHVGWRLRPDNLWAMGPLDNLVGMQYRIDHLENLKADAMDLSVWPPLKIKGEVEEFTWGPGAEIHLDENGDIEEVSKNMGAIITADQQISALEDKMELYAGAPREAMGIRTPGEKTAFEVNSLLTAAGRIFQEKATNFETELLEPLLNGMLEQSVRNMDEADVVRIIDTDLGVTQFKSITQDDLVAKGVLRPVGARHFSQQSQDLQNLIGVANSPLWATISPHVSGKNLAGLIDDIVNIRGYQVFRSNVAVMEARETQSLASQAAEDAQVEATGPSEADVPDLPPEELNVAGNDTGGSFENIPA
jgi:hypothetical protein